MRPPKVPAERETKYFYLFLVFIFILPLWPNYAELKFGGIPNLAPDRLIRIALLFGFIGIFFTNSVPVQVLKQRLALHSGLIFLLIAFYVLRVLSAFVSPNTIFQLYAFSRNELLVSLPVFFYALLAIRDEKSVGKIFATLVISGFFAGVIAMVDFYKQRNLFMGLVPVNSDYLMGVFLDKTRDESYRAQGTFEHPIMLGQFFTLLIPLIWTVLCQSKHLLAKTFYVVAGLISLASIYVSGSRAAQGLTLVAIGLFLLWELLAWIRSSKNRVLQYLVVSQIPIPITLTLLFAYFYKDALLGSSRETISSTNSRLEMLTGGVPKIFDAPLIGHGLGEHLSVFSLVGRAGIRTLDNFYLLVGLESGPMAIVLLIAFFAACIPKVRRLFKAAPRTEIRPQVAIGITTFVYSIQMALHSLHQQFWMVLLLAACLIVLEDAPANSPR